MFVPQTLRNEGVDFPVYQIEQYPGPTAEAGLLGRTDLRSTDALEFFPTALRELRLKSARTVASPLHTLSAAKNKPKNWN